MPVIEFPGLRDVKKIEMFKKFKPLIPVEYQDYEMYNEATDKMLQQAKDEKKEKMLRKRMSNPNCNYALGTIVKKRFERKFYVWKVVDYDVKEGRYKILYDDGDKEDFDEEDMVNYVSNKPTGKKNTKTAAKKMVRQPRGRPKKK